MTNRSFDFYFDFSSPYSYIAAEQIDALADKHGWRANWKPILLGVIFKATGGIPLTMAHPWKSKYSLADFERSARFGGVPFKLPAKFPQASQSAARAVLWLQQTQPSKAVPFALEVFRTLFVRDGDITDLNTLAAIAKGLDIDADAMMTAIQDGAIKQALIGNNDEAAALEVFGAPTFVLDGERFWGADRMPQLEHRLMGR
jgi:2-hydroxychromene-2-carboxylate isomerase